MTIAQLQSLITLALSNVYAVGTAGAGGAGAGSGCAGAAAQILVEEFYQ